MKYFKLEEFNCQHTGMNGMDLEFLERLDELRDKCGFPFILVSTLSMEACVDPQSNTFFPCKAN